MTHPNPRRAARAELKGLRHVAIVLGTRLRPRAERRRPAQEGLTVQLQPADSPPARLDFSTWADASSGPQARVIAAAQRLFPN